MNFIKRVLSTVTGIFVFLFICFALLLIIGLLAGSSSDEKVIVRDNSILNLKLDFPIKDYAGRTVFKQYNFLNENRKDGLFNIIDAIKYAATDEFHERAWSCKDACKVEALSFSRKRAVSKRIPVSVRARKTRNQVRHFVVHAMYLNCAWIGCSLLNQQTCNPRARAYPFLGKRSTSSGAFSFPGERSTSAGAFSFHGE